MPAVPLYVFVILTVPVASNAHEVTVIHPFPLFFSRYSIPVVVVVDFSGDIYTDAEICLPAIAIDGRTLFVLSHLGVMAFSKEDCTRSVEEISVADTGITYPIPERTITNANVTILFLTIKISSLYFIGKSPI